MKTAVILILVLVILIIYLTIAKRRSMEKVFSVDPAQLLIIDVRSEEEFSAGHFSSAINIPHDQIASRLDELKAHSQKGIVLYCHSGTRAGTAEKVLKSNGFTKVINAGGYDAIRKFDRND
jgi:phage shock protein E